MQRASVFRPAFVSTCAVILLSGALPLLGQSGRSLLPNDADRPIFISGTVAMATGEPLPESVAIERICSGNQLYTEGHSDTDGSFQLQLGGVSAGVSDNSSIGLTGGAAAVGNIPESRYWHCEIQARLAGYRSTRIPLTGRRYFDAPEIGVILLSPAVETSGLTVSATTELAPKDARKAFEEGLKALEDNNKKKAKDRFAEAVKNFDRHAEAWLQLGKLHEADKDLDKAREAYHQALAADPQFVYPYERLYTMAFAVQDWPTVNEMSARLIQLNPYEFPMAHYLNGVANLQLRNFAEAETSARHAIELDVDNKNPQSRYLLGFVQLELNKPVEAVAAFRAFLDIAPADREAPRIREILGQVEASLAQQGAGETKTQ